MAFGTKKKNDAGFGMRARHAGRPNIFSLVSIAFKFVRNRRGVEVLLVDREKEGRNIIVDLEVLWGKNSCVQIHSYKKYT